MFEMTISRGITARVSWWLYLVASNIAIRQHPQQTPRAKNAGLLPYRGGQRNQFRNCHGATPGGSLLPSTL
jgi:hypothetical protein